MGILKVKNRIPGLTVKKLDDFFGSSMHKRIVERHQKRREQAEEKLPRRWGQFSRKRPVKSKPSFLTQTQSDIKESIFVVKLT